MNDGGPFFPQELTFHDEVDVLIEDPKAAAFGEIVKQTKIRKERVCGISIRDWLAGQALSGMRIENVLSDKDAQAYSVRAFWIADAMLSERAKAK